MVKCGSFSLAWSKILSVEILKRLSRKKLIIGFGFMLAFAASMAASYLYFNSTKVIATEDGVVEPKAAVLQFSTEFEPVDPEISYNILLLGYGGEGHDGGDLSDVLIVANVDPEKKKMSLISIPRDTWVPIPVRSDKKENHKINAAFAIGGNDTKYPLKEPRYRGEFGGGEMAKHVAGQVIGMPIDYFIAVDFSGFEEAIDIIGGIDVAVPQTFDDYFYPVKGLENELCGKSPEEIAEVHSKYSGFQLEKQFECRYEHIHFDAGIAQMDGKSALKYVRSRHSEQHGGDFARSERQQALLVGLKDKIFSMGVLDDIVPFIDKLSHIFTTDIDKRVIQDAINTHGNLSDYTVSMTRLNEENVLQSSRSANGQFILIPKEGVGNWGGVHQYVLESASDLN